MDHLREEGRDVPGDLAPQRLGGASPDAFGPDEHAATSLSSARAISSRIASTESLLSPASGGRGTRLVAASGSFSSARPRWATRAWPTAPLARDPLTDTTGNRRPKSGCPGSVTSISTKSPSSGFWKGVPTDVLVRRGQPGVAGPLPGAPGRRPAHHPPDPEMAEGGRPRGRGHDGQRQGDRAGVGDLAAPRQPLPAPRLRPLGRARATARGHGRHDPRPLRGRHRGRLRARGRRPALPGRDARAAGGVRAVAASGQDPPDRVRPSRGGPTSIARARQAGDLRLPGLHLHLRHRAPRRLPGPAEEPARPRAGEARGDQGGVAATAAPADPRPGALAEAGRDRLLRLPRRADRRSRPGGVPLPRPRPVAAHAAPPQPEGRPHVGTGGEAGRPLAPQAQDPPSLAAAALRRQAPEVGAVCGKPARTVLCGGRPVMGVPTAIPPDAVEKAEAVPCVAELPDSRRLWPTAVLPRRAGLHRRAPLRPHPRAVAS